jgi:predicted DNA-binding transcriptional regulator AlpA
MSILSTGRGSRWVRNGKLAQYVGVSNMTIWRWKRDPELNFPAASEINGIEFNDLDAVDAWMRERLVERHGGKR